MVAAQIRNSLMDIFVFKKSTLFQPTLLTSSSELIENSSFCLVHADQPQGHNQNQVSKHF